MKETVKFILLALVFWGAHLAKAQQEDGDVESTDTTEFDEQNGTNHTSGGNRVGRIMGGVRGSSANKAYSVLMTLYGTSTVYTAGAIISNTEILTSASALKSAGTVTKFSIAAGIGTSMYQVVYVTYKSHEFQPGFDSATLANDVAIITINETFAGLSNVQSIAIATTEIAVSTTTRTTCVVVGRGQMPNTAASGTMDQTDYELLTDQECTSAFNQAQPSSILCARSVSGYACNVDSGAPLVCNGQLYGILTLQTGCTPSTPKIQKFAKLAVIRIPWNTPTISTPPRKNYVSCT
uniref:Putative trypsin n=1 Tax=Anopheles darlingi TaxID=43151 RepID=A0A2M4DQP7_ANODA